MSDATTRSDDPLHPDELERSQRRVRRHAHRARRRQAQRVVLAVAFVAAVGAAFAEGAPTGITVADVAYRMAFAAFVVVATSRAKRWTWFVLAGTAGAVGSDDLLPLLLGCGGLLASFASLRAGRRQREYGAVVGALSGNALLWLPTGLPFATPTIAATVVVTIVALSAVRYVRRPRRYVLGALAVCALLVVIAGGFVVAMLTVDSHASDGVVAANDGLAAASEGNDSASAAAFTVADREFTAASEAADAWWLAPARVVPVLAPHVDAARSIAAEGRSLAVLGADQAAVLDIRGLSSPAGGFDVARIAELTPLAATVADALEGAERTLAGLDSPWLLAPVADRIDEFADEVKSVAPTARNAADALALAPTLLGAGEQQTYLVLVGNPAEARELGGFVSSVGVLTADDGQLDFTSLDSITALNGQVRDSGRTLDLELPTSFVGSDPERFVQNWSNTADFSIVGEVAAQLGPAFTGDDVDGVLYLDPHVVAAMLELTGPVGIEGRAEPLTADQAVDYLLRDQYLADDFDDDGERKDRLRDAAEGAFDQLTSSALPDPRRFANLLSPLVHSRRLLFSTSSTEPHDLLTRVGLRPPLDGGATDQILVAHENLRANKLDGYLERSTTYDVTVGDDGSARGTVTVQLTNRAPAEGLPAYVTGDGSPTPGPEGLPEALNRVNLDLYSRLEPDVVTIDGDGVGFATSTQGELFRTNTQVDVPPSSSVTVVFELSGGFGDEDYTLEIVPNAGAGTDTIAANLDIRGVTRALDATASDRTHRLVVVRGTR